MLEHQRLALLRIFNTPSRNKMQTYEFNYALAVSEELTYRTRLANPEHEIDGGTTAKLGLTSALIMQGRYEEAREFADDELQKERISKLIEARDRDDEGFCDCPDTPHRTEKIYSEKHKDWVWMTECPKCRFINITPEIIK